jgi:hypothetical protein
MIRILIYAGLAIAFFVGMGFADVVPMVDRHIFMPDTLSEQKEEPRLPPAAMGSALEKEILFTGVLITPKGKVAMISENAKNEKSKQKRACKEGDEINGMKVKEIGSNYVLIVAKDNTVRLNLYKGAKNRPAPVPEPVNAESQPQGINPPNLHKPGVAPDANQQDGPKPAGAEVASPFGGGRGGEAAQNDSAVAPAPATANPFADIFKKGAGRRANLGGGAQHNMPLGN